MRDPILTWAEELVEVLAARVLERRRSLGYDRSESSHFFELERAFGDGRTIGAPPADEPRVAEDLALLPPAPPELAAGARVELTPVGGRGMFGAGTDFATSLYVCQGHQELAVIAYSELGRLWSVVSGETPQWTPPAPTERWDGKTRVDPVDPSLALARLLAGRVDLAVFAAAAFDRRSSRERDLGVVALFVLGLGLSMTSEHGESDWRGQRSTDACLATSPELAQAWRATRSGLIRAVPGDPCPACGAPLIDPHPDDLGGMPPTGGDYDYGSTGPIDLQCSKCARTVASCARRTVWFNGGSTSYET